MVRIGSAFLMACPNFECTRLIYVLILLFWYTVLVYKIEFKKKQPKNKPNILYFFVHFVRVNSMKTRLSIILNLAYLSCIVSIGRKRVDK